MSGGIIWPICWKCDRRHDTAGPCSPLDAQAPAPAVPPENQQMGYAPVPMIEGRMYHGFVTSESISPDGKNRRFQFYTGPKAWPPDVPAVIHVFDLDAGPAAEATPGADRAPSGDSEKALQAASEPGTPPASDPAHLPVSPNEERLWALAVSQEGAEVANRVSRKVMALRAAAPREVDIR